MNTTQPTEPSHAARWKSIEIEGYEHFSVSDYGDIKNTETGKLRKQCIVNGYQMVRLSRTGHPLQFLTVSRLVAKAFVEGDCNLTVNHIDGNKLNNHFSNLEWVSQQENVHHALRTGLTGTHPKKVGQYNLDGTFIREFDGITEAANATGVTRYAVGNCVNGKSRTSGGFIWKYLDYDNTKIEIPKDAVQIEGFENYSVCKNGTVYSQIRKKFVQPMVNNNGVTYVSLINGIIKQNFYVHRLVATVFIPNPANKALVYHINSDKTDNRVENLKWV